MQFIPLTAMRQKLWYLVNNNNNDNNNSHICVHAIEQSVN